MEMYTNTSFTNDKNEPNVSINNKSMKEINVFLLLHRKTHTKIHLFYIEAHMNTKCEKQNVTQIRNKKTKRIGGRKREKNNKIKWIDKNNTQSDIMACISISNMF